MGAQASCLSASVATNVEAGKDAYAPYEEIIKNSRVGLVPALIPVVIVSHEREFDSAPMMEVNLRRNEYVTRLSDYDQLAYLLEYLLPIGRN